ncbi:MAG: four helix bundle protein [candidate division Zixibacteria bacterium SM23_81]|nr:MAG: four helix bundle protein [candidate division Zixibacteria bacterium SM23_81]
MKINKLEDIEAWQRARKLVQEIYRITARDGFSKDFGLRDQIRRAAVSIMSSIAEGFGRRSNREFANFLNYSHGSTAEVQSHFYVALDQSYIEKKTFNSLYKQCDEISRMVLSLSKYLRKK